MEEGAYHLKRKNNNERTGKTGNRQKAGRGQENPIWY